MELLIRDINKKSVEGKLLVAALVILADTKTISPQQALDEACELVKGASEKKKDVEA